MVRMTSGIGAMHSCNTCISVWVAKLDGITPSLDDRECDCHRDH